MAMRSRSKAIIVLSFTAGWFAHRATEPVDPDGPEIRSSPLTERQREPVLCMWCGHKPCQCLDMGVVSDSSANGRNGGWVNAEGYGIPTPDPVVDTLTLYGWVDGGELAPGRLAWPLGWADDLDGQEAAHDEAGVEAHEWERVLVQSTREEVAGEFVVRCRVCRAPRCGHTMDANPCMLRRHHGGDLTSADGGHAYLRQPPALIEPVRYDPTRDWGPLPMPHSDEEVQP